MTGSYIFTPTDWEAYNFAHLHIPGPKGALIPKDSSYFHMFDKSDRQIYFQQETLFKDVFHGFEVFLLQIFYPYPHLLCID